MVPYALVELLSIFLLMIWSLPLCFLCSSALSLPICCILVWVFTWPILRLQLDDFFVCILLIILPPPASSFFVWSLLSFWFLVLSVVPLILLYPLDFLGFLIIFLLSDYLVI